MTWLERATKAILPEEKWNKNVNYIRAERLGSIRFEQCV